MIKRRTVDNTKWCCFLLFFSVFAMYHIVMTEQQGGDAMMFFSKALDGRSLSEYLIYRYYNWTSRVLIEVLVVFFSYHMRLFIIADFAVILILYSVVLRVTAEDSVFLVTGLFILYPFTEMASAGWLATLINYLFPLAACVLAYYPLDRIHRGEKVSRGMMALSCLSALFGCNQEQFCLLYLGYLVYYGFRFVLKDPQRSGRFLYLAQLCIAFLSLLNVLVCPGNHMRSVSETITWMPDFVQYNMIDKAVMGFNSTMMYLLNKSLVFAVFLVLLFVLTVVKSGAYPAKKRAVLRIIGIAPVLLLFAFQFCSSFFPVPFSYDYLSPVKMPNPVNWSSATSYVPFVVLAALLCCILLTLLHLGNDVYTGLEYSMLFLLGLASRVVMGFSPTIYASGVRTFMPLYAVLIVLTVKVFADNREYFRRNGALHAILRAVFGGLVAMSAVYNIWAVSRIG